MHNRLSYVRLVGRVTAVGPISITMPAPKPGSPPTSGRTDMFPTMPIRVGDVMRRVPIIPSTSIRGPLRRAATHEVIERMGPKPDGTIGMSRDDYQFNAIGGVKGTAKDTGGRDIHLARDILARNPIAALFGTGEIFTQGLLAVKEARLEGAFEVEEVTDYRSSVRRDDLARDPEFLGRFGAEDIARQAAAVEAGKGVSALREREKALKRKIQPLKRRADTLDAKERADLEAHLAEVAAVREQVKAIQNDPDGVFKEQTNTIYGFVGVAAGSTFSHSFRLDDPSHLQFGLFLAAARRFSRDCTIGGKVGVGAGEVAMEYEMTRHDGLEEDALGNPVERPIGRLSMAQDRTLVHGDDPFVLASVKAWKDACDAGFAGLDFSLPKRGPAKAGADEAVDDTGADEASDDVQEAA